MKILKTIILFLTCFNLYAQETDLTFYNPKKVVWDIQLAGAFVKQGDYLVLTAGSIQVNSLFPNHLCLSTSYLDAFELTLFDFDIAPAFGSNVPSVKREKEYLKSFSLSAGAHFGSSSLIVYGFVGPSYNRGFFYDLDGKNGQKVNNIGIDFKSSARISFRRHSGLSLQIRYNINNKKNFISTSMEYSYSF